MLHEIDLSRTDLNLLVVFQAVLEERHVARASRRLNLSPSAVSHSLGRLRSLLGDPLFLRTPRGVTPTGRAEALAAPIAEILARVREVVATAEPFAPERSTRRFTIGAPDGVSSVFLPPLLVALGREAPGIDLSVRQLLPRPGEPAPELAWRDSFADLEARRMEILVMPVDEVPARFDRRLLYEEDFVIAARAGHPFAIAPTLARYADAAHLVVSHAGDPFGFVDAALAGLGLSRRVALTAPNFPFALAVLAESDLIAALPRRFVARHGARFGLEAVEPPLALPRFRLQAVTPRVALMDAGLAWLVGKLEAAASA